MRKLFLSVLALAGLAGAIYGGVALAESVTIGNATFTVDGGFKPTTLPKKELAPIELTAEGKVTTDDGTTPPVVDTVTVDFDKNGTVDTKGIPQCDPRKLENTTTAQAKRKCAKSLVGTGTTRAIVDFDDQDPFDAIGPLLIFNGKKKGKNPTVVFHVLASVPLPTTFVVQAVISKSPKPGFGKRVFIKIPPVAGGNGTLVSFDAKINKRPASGSKHYLLARCANGRFLADSEIKLRDGPTLSIGITRPCKSKK